MVQVFYENKSATDHFAGLIFQKYVKKMFRFSANTEFNQRFL